LFITISFFIIINFEFIIIDVKNGSYLIYYF